MRLYPFRLQTPTPSTEGAVRSFPVLCAPFIRGVRATVIGNVLRGRDLKPVANSRLQEIYGRPELEGLEGVVTKGHPHDAGLCEALTFEICRKKDGEVNSDTGVRFNVYDCHLDEDLPLWRRRDALRDVVARSGVSLPLLTIVPYARCDDRAFLRQILAGINKCGFGVAWVMDPDAPYRRGGSPGNDAWLMEVRTDV